MTFIVHFPRFQSCILVYLYKITTSGGDRRNRIYIENGVNVSFFFFWCYILVIFLIKPRINFNTNLMVILSTNLSIVLNFLYYSIILYNNWIKFIIGSISEKNSNYKRINRLVRLSLIVVSPFHAIN